MMIIYACMLAKKNNCNVKTFQLKIINNDLSLHPVHPTFCIKKKKPSVIKIQSRHDGITTDCFIFLTAKKIFIPFC